MSKHLKILLGGSPHNGARACKQFHTNGQPFESEIAELGEIITAGKEEL